MAGFFVGRAARAWAVVTLKRSENVMMLAY